MSDTVDWIDLSAYGFSVVVATFREPSGSKAVVVRGDRPLPPGAAEALARSGFERVPGPRVVWARDGGRFRLGELAAAFPELAVVPMSRAATRVLIEQASPFVLRETAASPSPLSPAPGVGFGMRNALSRAWPKDDSPVRAASADIEDGVHDHEVVPVNRFQARYLPVSQIGTPIATVPTNMAAATHAALERVAAAHGGDLDSWVAVELGWTVAEMARYLSPEQVDAVALAMEQAFTGNGFILADQTGLGKGRVLAALLRWSAVRGRPAVFVTEKANLFTDIWRDIRDIASEDMIGRPLLLNDGSKIIDPITKSVLHTSPKPAELKRLLKEGELPPGCRLMLATYTQFNRKGSAKAEFLRRVADGAHVFLDESHNAVGESNTSENVGAALRVASAYTFSSATFARNAANMAAYAAVFPKSVSSLDLPEVLKAGGPPLLEALSQSLAEAGMLIRREHDLSNIGIEVRQDAARADQHRALADRMSPILSAMARLAMRVDDIVEEKALEASGTKEKWYTVNFGSRLAAIVRQFLTALKVDSCVEECVAALRAGKKPVVVVESTMEALMREIAADDGGGVRADEEELPLLAEPEDEEAAVPRPPTLRDALSLMLNRIMQISVKRPDKDPQKVEVDRADLVEEAERIRAMIEDFPDVSLSPIDDVRDRVEAEGRRLYEAGVIERPWVFDEISARGLRVVDGRYAAIEKRDRNEVIADFGAGVTDGLVITRAASTGLSLHASEKVQDRRPRLMIELQIPSNVVERVQFWGRVNRRGQVVEPEFLCLSTVLPFEVRMMAVQNRKVSELSANVTASSEAAFAMDVPDVIDSVGNDVCKRILQDRPHLAQRMGIPLRIDPERAEEELFFANKLLSRLVLLPADLQDRLYAEVLAAYDDVVRELEARGQHPHRGRELDGVWEAVAREVFDPGDPDDGAVFGRPVYVTTVRSWRDLRPLTGADVAALVGEARARHAAEWGGATPKDLFARHREVITVNRDRILEAVLPRRFATVRDALRASDDNVVKTADRKLRELLEAFKVIQAGCTVTLTNDDGVGASAVIIDVRLPPEEEAHLPGSYGVRYAFPGDEKLREVSLAALLRDPRYIAYGLPGKEGAPVFRYPQFDEAPRGRREVIRKILDGNLFAAVKASREHGFGTVISLTDTKGRRRRAVLIPKGKDARLGSIPVTTRSPQVVLEVLRQGGGPVFTNPENRAEGMVVWAERGRITIGIPGKKKPAKPFETPEILAAVGCKFEGDWRMREAVTTPDRLAVVLEDLASRGFSFHFEGQWRSLVLEAAKRERAPRGADVDDPTSVHRLG